MMTRLTPRPLSARLRRPAALVAAVVSVLAAVSGCTTSQVQQRYARHLSTVVEPNAPGHVDEVALVFGLDGAERSGRDALATGPDDTWTSRALTAAPSSGEYDRPTRPLPASVD